MYEGKHEYALGIAEDIERSDWTPLEALKWYADGKHFDTIDNRTRIIDTGAVASNALKHASLQHLELKGDAELHELRTALSAVTAERDRLREANASRSDKLNEAQGIIDQLRAEVEGLRKKAGKYATIERVMKMLECDEREGGIWTACTLLLIGSAHKMNSAKSVVDQEGVTVAAENLGNWRVTVERIDAAMAAKEV